jgi:hypothetical protein
MKKHQLFQTEDEILAQNVGISYARELFQDSLDVGQQDVSFSWGTFGDSAVRIAVVSLALYFPETKTNIIELKKITEISFITECEILVENAGSTLVIGCHSVDEIRNYLTKNFDGFYDKLKSRFKRDFRRSNPDVVDLDVHWKIAFTTLHTPTYVYNKAFDYLERYLNNKGLESTVIQELHIEFTQYLKNLFLGADLKII